METNQQQLQAEILARHQVARMHPRDWPSVTSKLVAACQNPDFARLAYYTLPLALGHGEALSLRYAELAQQLMHNVAYDAVPVGEDEAAVHYRVTVTDLESNTALSERLPVARTVIEPRQRINSVKRALLLALLPSEIRARCLAECRSVVRREDGKEPEVFSKEILADLKSLGVTVGEIKGYLGHAPGVLDAPEIERLRSIALLIRDGELTWAAVVGTERAAVASDSPEPKKLDKKKPKAPKAPRQARAARAAASPPPATPPKSPPVSRRDSDSETSAGAEPAPPA